MTAVTEAVARLPANRTAGFSLQVSLTAATEFPLLSSLRVSLFSWVQKVV